MNKEILMVVDAVSNEKGVDKEIIFEALEQRWLRLPARSTARTGTCASPSIARPVDYETFRRWKVFADDSKDLENPSASCAWTMRAT